MAATLAMPVAAQAETRASGLVAISGQAAASACLANQAAGDATPPTSAQATQQGGCILPLRAAPVPSAPATPPSPPVAAPAQAAPVVTGNTGWLVPALAGLAALVAAIALIGGDDDGDLAPGISPG